MTASAHKIGGIRGAGLTYINKDSTSIEPLLFGGNQEDMLRAGTENTAAIVGFGKASEIAMKNFDENRFKVIRMRDYLFNRLSENIRGCHLNGNMITCDSRLYNNINCRFDDVNNMQLQGFLAQNNICISTGSACSTGISIPSYTLKAIGLTDKECFESIRITLSHHNTIEECDEVVDCIKFFVNCARTK
jgi:cysteine desulfurase